MTSIIRACFKLHKKLLVYSFIDALSLFNILSYLLNYYLQLTQNTVFIFSRVTNSLNHSYCKCIIRKNLDLPYLAFLQGDQIGKAFNQIQNPCLSSRNGIKIYEMCSWHVKGKKLLALNSDS